MKKDISLTEYLKKIGGTKNSEDLPVNMLCLSYKFLDSYYGQIGMQEKKSFIVVIIMAILGFIITLAGIMGILFFNLDIAGYVTTSAGIITNFITGVFFYVFNKTSKDMKDYFKQLLLSHNLAVSLVITDELPDDKKSEKIQSIIDVLLTDYNKYLVGQASQ